MLNNRMFEQDASAKFVQKNEYQGRYILEIRYERYEQEKL